MIKRIYKFYSGGFKRMTWGRELWLIIVIKLAIMFLILKLFFFPNILNQEHDTDQERANHVIEQLTK